MPQNPGQFNSNDDIILAMDTIGISNTNDTRIDPSTEEKQDDIITELQKEPRDFYMEVSKSNVSGIIRAGYGGNVNDLSSADGLKEIWNGPGSRTKLAAPTTLYVSSTDTGDVGSIFIANGMDADYNLIIATAVLNGQNQVQLSADIWKVYAMSVISGNHDGAIYLAESDTLTAGVPDTDSKIQLVAPIISGVGLGFGSIAEFTVPAGKTAYITTLALTPSGSSNKDVTAYLAFDVGGSGTFVINPASFEMLGYNIEKQFIPPFSLPEKTTLSVLGKTTSSDVNLSVLIELTYTDN